MSINKVSFGGKSLQNLVFDGGKSEYFYFKAGANTDWFNVQNWYKDSGFTVPANELPGNDDIAVVLNSNLSSSTSQTVKIGYLIFERNIGRYDYSDQWDNNNPGNFTLSASLKINATVGVIIKNYDVIIQPAWTLGSITNYATITAPSITIDSCNNYGTLNGTVTFSTTGQSGRWEAAGYNYGTINGNANFYGYSVNMGIVNVLTSSSFNDSSINSDSGVVNGAVTFNNNSYWSWFSYAANAGTVNGDAVFNNAGNWGTINGSAVFNNTNHESGTITGDVTFNGGWNNSTINNGNVVFNGNSYNDYGSINNSTQTTTFNGSSAHGYWASISGGNVIFNSYSRNSGYVNVNNLTFNNSSYNESWGINASAVTFNDSSYNNAGDYWTYGINSTSIIFNNSSYMYGSINSTNVTFNDNSYTQSSSYRVTATSVTFNNSSTNNCPYVEGTSTFNDTSYNNGFVYDAIFNDSSYNNNFVDNTAIFNNNSYNQSTSTGPNPNSGGAAIESATFNDNSYNAGTVWDAVFNDSSAHNNSMGSVIYNNATFNDASNQYGPVNGTITCNTTGVCTVPDPLKLLMHFDGSDNSTTFTDSSSYSLIPSWTGNTVISTSQSKFGGSSAYFNGNSTGIDYGTNPNFAMGSGDFTAEAWIYYQGQNTNFSGSQIMGCHQAGSGASWLLAIESTGEVWAHINGTTLISAYYVPQNTWTHVAMVRYNGTLYLYIDGVSRGTPVSATGDIGIPYNFVIGTDCCSNYRFIGYMDDIRVMKGTAVYTSNFTPPSMPLGTETSLLLHFDGANGSSSFVDSGSNALTVTANGGATISTTQSKFGGSSGYFSGTPANGSSNLSIPTNTNFGTNDFTIEAWIWIDPTTCNVDGPCICELGSHSGLGSDGFIFMTGYRSGAWILWGWLGPSGGSGGLSYSSSYINPNEWTHVAVTRQNNIFRMFINGTKCAEETRSDNLVGSNNSIQVGGSLNGAVANAFGGYIDDLRVIKGAALYTSNFIPEGSPQTILSMSMTGNNIVDESALSNTLYNNMLTANNNALDFNGSGYFNISGDNTAFNLGTSDFTIETWAYFNTITGTDNGQHIIEFRNGGESDAPTLYLYQGILYWYVNGANVITATASISYDTWMHIAVSRANGVTRLYVNGAQAGSDYADSTDYKVQSNRPVFGVNTSGSMAYLNGSLDDIKIIKNQGLYSSSFTPPTRSV